MCRQRSDHVLTGQPSCRPHDAVPEPSRFCTQRWRSVLRRPEVGGERLAANHSGEEAGVSTHRQGI